MPKKTTTKPAKTPRAKVCIALLNLLHCLEREATQDELNEIRYWQEQFRARKASVS